MKAKTSLYGDSFFVRICNIWNTLPGNISAKKELPSLVKKLKYFFYLRLSKVFNQDNIPFLKLVCVECCCFNTPNAYIHVSQLPFSFLLLMIMYFAISWHGGL